MEEIKSTPQRFYNVDFLRFIMAIGIIMLHCVSSLKIGFLKLPHSTILVEFFFILGGFFLFKNIRKEEDTSIFALKKIIRLAPTLLFLIGLTALTSIFIKGLHVNFNDELLRIFFLQHIGLSKSTGFKWVGIGWFSIVFFWVSLFYFYINKIFEKKYLNLIIWMLIIFSYGIYFNAHQFQTGMHSTNLLCCFNSGILRGLGSMGIGYFILMLYQTNFLKKCSREAQIIITAVEAYCGIFLIKYLFFSTKIPGKSPLLYIVIFSILFYLFLRKQGFISKILDKKIFGFGGKYSYSMYIMHGYILNLVFYLLILPHTTFTQQHLNIIYVLEVLTAVIFSIVIYYLFEKPVTKYLLNKYIKK